MGCKGLVIKVDLVDKEQYQTINQYKKGDFSPEGRGKNPPLFWGKSPCLDAASS
jgi:hypothetical protein